MLDNILKILCFISLTSLAQNCPITFTNKSKIGKKNLCIRLDGFKKRCVSAVLRELLLFSVCIIIPTGPIYHKLAFTQLFILVYKTLGSKKLVIPTAISGRFLGLN